MKREVRNGANVLFCTIIIFDVFGGECWEAEDSVVLVNFGNKNKFRYAVPPLVVVAVRELGYMPAGTRLLILRFTVHTKSGLQLVEERSQLFST